MSLITRRALDAVLGERHGGPWGWLHRGCYAGYPRGSVRIGTLTEFLPGQSCLGTALGFLRLISYPASLCSCQRPWPGIPGRGRSHSGAAGRPWRRWLPSGWVLERMSAGWNPAPRWLSSGWMPWLWSGPGGFGRAGGSTSPETSAPTPTPYNDIQRFHDCLAVSGRCPDRCSRREEGGRQSPPPRANNTPGPLSLSSFEQTIEADEFRGPV
jgi:hypothetical protein